MAREIPLTQGMVAIVDDESYDYLNQWRWQAVRKGNRYYARRGIGRKIRVYMHNILLPTELEVDHKDRNTLNNQKSNLRVATRSENGCNRKDKDNQFGYRGLSKAGDKWQAQIQKDNKRYYLGCYNSSVEAALVYDKAAIKLHGEFAYLNFKNQNQII